MFTELSEFSGFTLTIYQTKGKIKVLGVKKGHLR